MKTLLLICVALVTLSCAPIPPVDLLADPDLEPPFVVSVELADESTLKVEFDEPVTATSPEVYGDEALGVIDWSVTDTIATFAFEQGPAPGLESFVEAQVQDDAGNNLRFLARFYGRNDNLPQVVLNEITTQGSSTRPDIVELAVLSDGDLAGLTVIEGTPGNWEQRIVLPELMVSAGDFVIVHFKPDGTAEEIDEVISKNESGGKNTSDEGWDFWVPGGTGLSGNNGVISLTRDPFGGYLDAFLYSNRTSTSDTSYAGFGSRDVLERANEIAEAGMWQYAGDAIAPEDAVNPEPSTATRSMARSSLSADSDSKSDWHITPTSGISPGTVNTDEEYEG
jgi:hypothetical protein